jgi:hypothetical protein
MSDFIEIQDFVVNKNTIQAFQKEYGDGTIYLKLVLDKSKVEDSVLWFKVKDEEEYSILYNYLKCCLKLSYEFEGKQYD